MQVAVGLAQRGAGANVVMEGWVALREYEGNRMLLVRSLLVLNGNNEG